MCVWHTMDMDWGKKFQFPLPLVRGITLLLGVTLFSVLVFVVSTVAFGGSGQVSAQECPYQSMNIQVHPDFPGLSSQDTEMKMGERVKFILTPGVRTGRMIPDMPLHIRMRMCSRNAENQPYCHVLDSTDSVSVLEGDNHIFTIEPTAQWVSFKRGELHFRITNCPIGNYGGIKSHINRGQAFLRHVHYTAPNAAPANGACAPANTNPDDFNIHCETKHTRGGDSHSHTTCKIRRNGCASGLFNADAFADTASHIRWRCDGTNGGTDSEMCMAVIPDKMMYYSNRQLVAVGGKCAPLDAGTVPTPANSCNRGTYRDIADTSAQYRWQCDTPRICIQYSGGSCANYLTDPGVNATCSVDKQAPQGQRRVVGEGVIRGGDAGPLGSGGSGEWPGSTQQESKLPDTIDSASITVSGDTVTVTWDTLDTGAKVGRYVVSLMSADGSEAIKKKSRKRRRRPGAVVVHFKNIEPGSYVVHLYAKNRHGKGGLYRSEVVAVPSE